MNFVIALFDFLYPETPDFDEFIHLTEKKCVRFRLGTRYAHVQLSW